MFADTCFQSIRISLRQPGRQRYSLAFPRSNARITDLDQAAGLGIGLCAALWGAWQPGKDWLEEHRRRRDADPPDREGASQLHRDIVLGPAEHCWSSFATSGDRASHHSRESSLIRHYLSDVKVGTVLYISKNPCVHEVVLSTFLSSQQRPDIMAAIPARILAQHLMGPTHP